MDFQNDSDYQNLLQVISQTFLQNKQKTIKTINTNLTLTYWEVGKHIVEYEQNGKIKAEYGKKVLVQLAKDLKPLVDKGFSRSKLVYARLLYAHYPKSATLSHQLTWSHYIELLKIDDELERSFYEKQAIQDKLTVRELQRQIETALFQRLALSMDKEGIMALARDGYKPNYENFAIQDPYIFEFLGLPTQQMVKEKVLEDKLITHLQNFLLELGKGFAYIGRQYRISIGNKHFYVDLVFYHRILKCFVLIDLKSGLVQHEDVGQMNLYINYFKTEENVEGDNEPIGIILSAQKDDVMVEYALGSITNKLLVAKYQLYLPDKELLTQKVREILEG